MGSESVKKRNDGTAATDNERASQLIRNKSLLTVAELDAEIRQLEEVAADRGGLSRAAILLGILRGERAKRGP